MKSIVVPIRAIKAFRSTTNFTSIVMVVDLDLGTSSFDNLVKGLDLGVEFHLVLEPVAAPSFETELDHVRLGPMDLEHHTQLLGGSLGLNSGVRKEIGSITRFIKRCFFMG